MPAVQQSSAPIYPILVPKQGEAPHTIHRVTPTHHGRTLVLLGDAADYLQTNSTVDSSRREAAHILRRLAREVFDEYAAETWAPRPLTDWFMRQAVRIYGAA
jgi:hypothetical protein